MIFMIFTMAYLKAANQGHVVANKVSSLTLK